MSVDLATRLVKLSSPWPDGSNLKYTSSLRARLELLSDSASGISLTKLKDASLPAWKEGDSGRLAARIARAEEAATRDEVLIDELTTIVDGSPTWTDDEELGDRLLAARILYGMSDGLGRRKELDAFAVAKLVDLARVGKERPDCTFFSMWLLEVAASWLGPSDDAQLQSRLDGELGALLAQTGAVPEGTRLLRATADRLFGLEDTSAAWLYRYRWAEWLLRSKTDRQQGISELRTLHGEHGAPEASEAWFHAGFELVAADARPGAHPAAMQKAKTLLDRLDAATLPESNRKNIAAHAHHALGHALSFGRNRQLHDKAMEHYAQASAMYRELRDWPNLAQVLDGQGRNLSQLGMHPQATIAFEASLEQKASLKDLWGFGASLNGLAQSLVRRGRSLEAVPLYDANLSVMRSLDAAPTTLKLQNLGLKVNAYLAPYANPVERTAPKREHLDEARRALEEYERAMAGQPDMALSSAYHLMLRGGLLRLEARLEPDATGNIALLLEGERLARRSINEFNQVDDRNALPNAEIFLAGLLVDRARLLPLDDPERQRALDEARTQLEAAERHIWDTYEQAYLQLEWASYLETRGEKSKAQNHLALARLHAEFCGNESIRVDLQMRLGVHLAGPTGEDRAEVVLPPGHKLDVGFRARDWQGRPLARYRLRALVETGYGFDNIRLSVTPETEETDKLGQAVFHFEAPADVTGRVLVRVEDRNVIRDARVVVHVRPFQIEYAPGVEARAKLDDDEQAVVRQLFGSRFGRVLIQQRFGGGKSGAKILLIQPFIDLPEAAGASSRQTSALRGQRCIIKIGPRQQITDEVKRYDRYVRDLLPANVSQYAAQAVWGDKAGIRMSLAGGREWGRAADEVEWLVDAWPLAAHHLLELIFAGDLASGWYANGSASSSARPLVDAYAAMMPVLVTLRDPRLTEGLLIERPSGAARSNLEGGLLPPGDRNYDRGHRVYLGEMKVVEYVRAQEEWRYELESRKNGLRARFHTPVPPDQMDPDGVADNLLGRSFHLAGTVENLTYDVLADTLEACIGEYPRQSGEQVSLASSGQLLEIRLPGETLMLPNPLPHLHEILRLALRCRRSVIHGDLHTRNVIVGSQGLPYYIDFGKTDMGPTLFDFIKHEVYLWSWSFIREPKGTLGPDGTITNAVRLMKPLAAPDNRYPSPFVIPDDLGDPQAPLARFYQWIATVRLLSQPYAIGPRAQDYFAPLCLYAALMLRWSDPRSAAPEERSAAAADGLIQTILSGMLLRNGMVDGLGLHSGSPTM